MAVFAAVSPLFLAQGSRRNHFIAKMRRSAAVLSQTPVVPAPQVNEHEKASQSPGLTFLVQEMGDGSR